jgi:hypothetical protein
MADCACRSLTWKTETYLAQGGYLSAQRLDHPDDLTDPRPMHRATGRDCGLWAAVFATNAPLSRFGEGHRFTAGWNFIEGGGFRKLRSHGAYQLVRSDPFTDRDL